MTEQQFYSSIKVLAVDTKKLQASANKLATYAKRNKKDKSKALFEKIAFDTDYLKALYNRIQNWAYWHKDKIDQAEWEVFTKEFAGFFNQLETIIGNIKARNEVIS
jgi:hypothetical protein